MIAPVPRIDFAAPALLEAPGWQGRVRAEWFDCGSSALAMEPVRRGGRGAAWELALPWGAAVLRAYRRGGLLARCNRDRYLWRGVERTRCVRELRLLLALRGAGLPVPEPLAAAWWREPFTYRAALLMRRVPVRCDFMERVCEDAGSAPWAEVGRTLARFHRYGARHPDLNARNLLLAEDDAVVLIDWDRGSLGHRPGRWCSAELDRLERSLRKLCPDRLASTLLDQGMAGLRAAHARALAADGRT